MIRSTLILIFAATFLGVSAEGAAPRKAKSPKSAAEQRAEEDQREVEKFERDRKAAARIFDEMKKDRRHPTKEDISGCWSSGPNLVGIDLQLDQKGEAISGRGFDWGCMGIYAPLKINGTYRNEKLALTVTWASGEKFTYRMKYVATGKFPRLESTDKERKSYSSFQTAQESAERNAKVQK